MFSQTVEYALRAIVHLADSAPDSQTKDEIAAATLVPPAYLSKVLQSLRKADIIQTQRGVGGGMRLVGTPETLTILQVVNAVDPIKRIETCPLGIRSHGKNLCPLHRRMDEALASVESAFGATTLSEVLSEPHGSYPLCSHPPVREGQLNILPTLPCAPQTDGTPD
ncbi:MAG: Rrf2 family transcriptional regulator [Planctomycetaceae bacterium]|nr:Rrf2 family transcriptional regulator [Planctomycetaceae bacterium]